MGDHEHTAIKHLDHILLDQSLLRLPYELLRNNFRSAHFAVEKESAGIKSLLKDAATGCLNGKSGQDDLVRSLDDMISQAQALKRKLEACSNEEARLLHQSQSRIRHVDELWAVHSFDDVKYESWSHTRLDRLMVDFMLRKGCTRSAAALSEERNMDDLVDMDTLVAMNRIRESLKRGSVQEALQWCSQNKKELRKMDGRLEFDLRFQQFIEMIRSNTDPMQCVIHVRKYLLPHAKQFNSEVRAACGMLAFKHDSAQKTGISYEPYFSPDRWVTLADLFTETHNALLSLPSVPLLQVALASGLSALKTPACHAAARADADSAEHNPAPTAISATGQPMVCPVCSPELQELAMNVPYAHHTKSIVEHELVVLPNGRVYGTQTLEQHARKLSLPAGQIKDLQTGEIYAASSAKKVFIT